jgi:UDP-GlcNAc:undecaprenyl-phosphate/decaprenyl-phosphate GlcNAc-1-phosphate transferase
VVSLWLLLYIGAAGIFSWLVALYLGPILIAVACKLNILDIPDSKLKVHKAPTPYLGGLVVYLATLISLIFFFPFQNASLFFILGSTLLLLVGLIDDVLPLKPYQKFFGQFIAAICFLKGGFYLKETFFFSQQHPALYYFWVIVSLFWMLSIINAFNLVDVMDGLAATIAFMAAFSFLVIALIVNEIPAAILCAIFMGALAGFLRYNLPPAKMYLGDAGSLFIGGVMAIIPFMIHWGTFSWYGYLAPPFLLGIVAIEIVTLIIIRRFKGIPFYNGSPHHFCHFLKSHGWSTRSILLYTVLISLGLLIFQLLYLLNAISLISFIAIMLFGAFFWYIILLFGMNWLF